MSQTDYDPENIERFWFKRLFITLFSERRFLLIYDILQV